MFAQCVAALSPTCLLAAAHPRGLVLLRRDVEDEAASLQQAERRAVAQHEQGGGGGEGRGRERWWGKSEWPGDAA